MRRRKKRHPILLGVTIAFFLGISGLYICRDQVKDLVVQKAASVAAEKLFEEKLHNSGLLPNNVKVSDVMDSVDKEDMKKITTIVEENLTQENIDAMTEYAKNRDKEGIKNYVKSTLNEQQQAEITSIYNKYKDQLQHFGQ